MRFRKEIDVTVVRKKVIEAFKLLRKKGLIARSNFSCCQNCAGYAIAGYLEELPESKRKKIKGVVYWHKQDEQSFRESGTLYLAYGDVDTKKCGVVGLPTAEVGKIICDTFKELSIPFEWNGNGETRIKVLTN